MYNATIQETVTVSLKEFTTEYTTLPASLNMFIRIEDLGETTQVTIYMPRKNVIADIIVQASFENVRASLPVTSIYEA